MQENREVRQASDCLGPQACDFGPGFIFDGAKQPANIGLVINRFGPTPAGGLQDAHGNKSWRPSIAFLPRHELAHNYAMPCFGSDCSCQAYSLCYSLMTVVPLNRRIKCRISKTLSVARTCGTGSPLCTTISSIEVASQWIASSTFCSMSFRSNSPG